MLIERIDEKHQMPVSEEFDPEDEYVSLVVSESLQEEYFKLYANETVIVLLTTGEKSVLATGDVGESNGRTVVNVDSGACEAIGADNNAVDGWIIPNEQKVNLNYDDSHVKNSDNDPTNGSWLLLKTAELALSDSSEDRRVYINKAFRERVALPCGKEVQVLCEAIDDNLQSVMDSSVGSVNIPESGKRITIPESVVSNAGIGEDETMSVIWLSTKDIATQKQVRRRESGEYADKSSNDGESVGELNFSVDEGGGEKVEQERSAVTSDTVQSESNGEYEKSDWNGGSAERFIEGEDDAVDNKNTDQQSERNNNGVGENKRVEIQYTTDVTPVVLLDDDERLDENWTGHYKNENGELLCGKQFSSSIEDTDKEHYDEICIECAMEKPGSIKQRDVADAIKQIAGFSIGEEEPFVLSHEDAAELLSVFKEMR